MIPDKLLINLKIISKIQKNGRIARSFDGIISLENDAFYQSVKRFITNDSRKQAVFEINSVVTECIDILHHITNSKFMHKMYYQTNEYIKNCECIGLLLKEMEYAKCGVDNLKFTYQNDPNIVSQIDILLLKINTIIKDFSQKLMFFQSFIQNDQYIQYNTFPQEIPLTNGKVPNGKEMLSSSFSNGGNAGSFGGTVVGSFNQRTEIYDENVYTELQSIKIEGGNENDNKDILDDVHEEMY
jgi:hypothetical protein